MRHERKRWHRGVALFHALFSMPFHSLHFNLQRNAVCCPFLVGELIPKTALILSFLCAELVSLAAFLIEFSASLAIILCRS